MTEKEFFKTTNEAAQYFGVSGRTIRRWEKTGRFGKDKEGYSRLKLQIIKELIGTRKRYLPPFDLDEILKLYQEIEVVTKGLRKYRLLLGRLLGKTGSCGDIVEPDDGDTA